MIDVMTRLKIHHLAEAGVPQATIAARCGVGLRSVERIIAAPAPTREEVATNQLASAPRRGRPPKADGDQLARIRLLLEAEPKLPAIEVLRRAREWGVRWAAARWRRWCASCVPHRQRSLWCGSTGCRASTRSFTSGSVRWSCCRAVGSGCSSSAGA